MVSHRHTILRQGAGNFEEFVARGASEDSAARALEQQWIQHGRAAPGGVDKIRLYDAYLRKMKAALGESEWLIGAAGGSRAWSLASSACARVRSDARRVGAANARG